MTVPDANTFEWGQRTYVMGIINITPDSFSGDGVLESGTERAVAQAVYKRWRGHPRYWG